MNNCCPQDAQTPFNIPGPGFYPFDFVFGEQGGGDWLDLGISGPGINGTVALGDVVAGSPRVFTISFPDDDLDGDGLPDFIEMAIIDADEEDAIETIEDVLPGDDFDNDGLTNIEEPDLRTDPVVADTDGDGLSDGDEVNTHETDPLQVDTDRDGLSDGDEVAIGTDPGNPDTDGDTVPDGLDNDPLNPGNGYEFGLIAYWPMEGDLMNAQLDDFHGTEDGGAIPFEVGKFGDAIHLDGTQSVIIGGDENVFDFEGGSMTVSVWVTADVIDTNWQCIIAKGEGNGWRMHRRGGDNPPEMAWTGGNGDINAHGTPFMIGTDPETWHNFVGVTDSSTGTQYLYQDGVLLGEKTGANLQNRGNPMRIGENPDALNRRWKGKIDDVAIWSRALTVEEITEISANGGTSVEDLLGGGIPIVEPQKGKGVSERSVSPAQFGQFMVDVFEEWRKGDIGKVYVSHFDNALGMHLGMPSSICVHAPQCGENLVIEHNGDVYSCDHFVYPEFKVGNINQRDYPDLIETPVQQQFSSRKPIGSQTHCLQCDQRSLCNGACPAQRIDENGELSISAKHYLCEGYYQLFSHLRPYLEAMGRCLQRGLPPLYYTRFMRQN